MVTNTQLVKWLETAVKQRERAEKQMIADYGPNGALAITNELEQLRDTINMLKAGRKFTIEGEKK